MDLIFQLEALNPTPDATNVNTIGEVTSSLLSCGHGRASSETVSVTTHPKTPPRPFWLLGSH